MSDFVSSHATNRVPEPVARIAHLMSTFRPTWTLCGGWAVDAWLGRKTRDHGDVDISVFHDDQRALFDHLAGWELIAHDAHVADDTSEPWDGRHLKLPAHIHGRPLESHRHLPDRLPAPAQAGFTLDIQLDERSGDDWILSDEPRITVPIRSCFRQSGWGLPTLVAELVLFYKAKELRPNDEALLALLPHLADRQCHWLGETIARVHPGHPWVAHLSPREKIMLVLTAVATR